MTLANKLTVLRIVMAFVFIVCLFAQGIIAKCLALAVFIAAALTDYLDGYLAKKRNEITDFGMIMDPIADKVLTLSAFIGFVEMGIVPAWMVVIIISRELIVTGIRIAAFAGGRVIAAGKGGKHKTVFQIFSILTILVFIVFKEAGVSVCRFWNPAFEYWYRQGIFILMIITVLLTVISGISYLRAGKNFFDNRKRGSI
ncbi:MAG: CDP-diacylglycerol--glycerol-3-phosphate 3-phosphatidyltransferase [Candidatus Omnitrophota bacterium]